MPPREAPAPKVQQRAISKPVDLIPTTTSSYLLPSVHASNGVIAPEPSTNLPSPSISLDDEFSKDQIYLSIQVVKSRPPNLSIEDYTQHMVKRIKLESSSPVSEGERRCIDTVEYWKDNYSKVYAEKLALEAILERLKVNNRVTDETIGFQALITNNETISLFSSRKRKIDALCSRPLDESEDDELSGPARTPPSVPLSSFLLIKHAQVLHCHLSCSNVAPKILLESLATTLSYVADTLEATTSRSPFYYSKHELQHTFQTAAAVYNICLRGLAHLCRDIPGRAIKGRVIYLLINLFKSVLKWNRDLCHTMAKTEITYREAECDEQPLDARSTDPPDTTNINIPYLLTARTQFLALLLQSQEFSTESQQTCHAEVLEGLLALLLNRIGELVSETVFGEKVAESTLPGHISMIPPNQAPDRMESLRVKLEAGQMALLLRCVRKQRGGEGELVEGKELKTDLSELIRGRGTWKNPEGNGGKMMEVSRRRLQDTLCKAVFGEDNGEFANALKVPHWEEEEELGETERRRKTVDGKDFVETVWQNVGWDVLGNM